MSTEEQTPEVRPDNMIETKVDLSMPPPSFIIPPPNTPDVPPSPQNPD